MGILMKDLKINCEAYSTLKILEKENPGAILSV